MLTRRFALRSLALIPPALIAACRSADPVLFTLLPVPGTPRSAGPRVVAVREVGLARYLDRLQIVKSAQDYRLDVSNNDWWGEPLEAMTTRLLVENLAQRLPKATVFSTTGAITVPADATVEANLQRLGTVTPGAVTTTAQVAVTFKDARRRTVSRTENFVEPAASTATKDFVAAASAGLGRLSDAIAALLTS